MKSIEFDYKKATQALNFLACESPEQKINKMQAIKLVWIADRYHLRKYGRPITGDDYVAMNYGPVASTVKDIAEKSGFLATEERSYANEYIDKLNQYTIKCAQSPDLRVFSKTDLEALQFALDNFGNQDQYKLAKFSHQYPEWAKFKEEFEAKTTTREDMSYIDFFGDPFELKDDKFKENQELLEINKKNFIERSKILDEWQ